MSCNRLLKLGGLLFIHEKLDIKILILFILRRLPGEVDPHTLAELCQCDEGVGYFDYSDCLHELISSGHIDELGKKSPYSDKIEVLKLREK